MFALRKNAVKKATRKKKIAESRGDNLARVKQEVTIQKEGRGSCCEVEDVQVESEDIEATERNDSGALKSRRQNRRSKLRETDIEDLGTIYPLDIWFLISEYMRPEDVGNFALICRSTYYVTKTAKFWFHLYKSYYKFVSTIPERLQPSSMGQTYGLRASVIRALHHTYFPLKKNIPLKNKSSYLMQEQPHTLVKRQCRAMWHRVSQILILCPRIMFQFVIEIAYCYNETDTFLQDDTLKWYFYFKLKEVSRSSNGSIKRKSHMNGRNSEHRDILEDVAVNPDEGCKVLRVTRSNYTMLPLVIGLILQKVSLTLMPGFSRHRLQLAFGTSDIPSTLTTQIILNDVSHYQVLDWWHPSFP